MPKKLSPEELVAKEERAKLKAERDEARAKIKADKEAVKAAKLAAKSGEVASALASQPAEPEAPKKVKFEGAEVLEILTTKHTTTHFHCKMSDGTSKHVPKELFE